MQSTEYSPSKKRAITAQERWETAQRKTASAKRLEAKERERFVNCLMEAVEDDPKSVNDGWIFHHLNNTVGLHWKEIESVGNGETNIRTLIESQAKAAGENATD